jgi:predicted DNA-binding protein
MREDEKTDKPAAFLLRDIPRELMDKLRAAAAIHKRPLKTYIAELFEAHIEELERKGLILSHAEKCRRH